MTTSPLHRRGPRSLALLALAAAIAVAGALALVPALEPRVPALLGIGAPRAGAALELDWRLGGVTIVIVDPLDPPARFENGVPAPRVAGERWRRGAETAIEIAAAEEARGASCAAVEDLLGRDALAEALASGGSAGSRALLAAPRCPAAVRADLLSRAAERSASFGEEGAADEAYASSDLDRAIARARLALEICPWSGAANAIAGSALLERGVRRYRTGDPNGAAADLDEALARLADPDERARALYARGLVAKRRGEIDFARECFSAAAITAPFHPAAAAGRKEK